MVGVEEVVEGAVKCSCCQFAGVRAGSDHEHSGSMWYVFSDQKGRENALAREATDTCLQPAALSCEVRSTGGHLSGQSVPCYHVL